MLPRFSQIFPDFPRFSQIFPDFPRLSQIEKNWGKLGNTHLGRYFCLRNDLSSCSEIAEDGT
jgi:hypothetical protein